MWMWRCIVCFVDYRNASDRVNDELLIDVMSKAGKLELAHWNKDGSSVGDGIGMLMWELWVESPEENNQEKE